MPPRRSSSAAASISISSSEVVAERVDGGAEFLQSLRPASSPAVGCLVTQPLLARWSPGRQWSRSRCRYRSSISPWPVVPRSRRIIAGRRTHAAAVSFSVSKRQRFRIRGESFHRPRRGSIEEVHHRVDLEIDLIPNGVDVVLFGEIDARRPRCRQCRRRRDRGLRRTSHRDRAGAGQRRGWRNRRRQWRCRHWRRWERATRRGSAASNPTWRRTPLNVMAMVLSCGARRQTTPVWMGDRAPDDLGCVGSRGPDCPGPPLKTLRLAPRFHLALPLLLDGGYDIRRGGPAAVAGITWPTAHPAAVVRPRLRMDPGGQPPRPHPRTTTCRSWSRQVRPYRRWRIAAVAHDRIGHQSQSEHRFRTSDRTVLTTGHRCENMCSYRDGERTGRHLTITRTANDAGG